MVINIPNKSENANEQASDCRAPASASPRSFAKAAMRSVLIVLSFKDVEKQKKEGGASSHERTDPGQFVVGANAVRPRSSAVWKLHSERVRSKLTCFCESQGTDQQPNRITCCQ